MIKTPSHITGMTQAQLENLVKSMGEPGYRAKQLRKWIYQSLAFSFDEMSDLPAAFRQRLSATTRLHSLKPEYEVTGQDGTLKILFSLADGLTIEAALMSYPKEDGGGRSTICVSTQVGCAIGCPFCATGRQGFQRNLTTGEIIDQALYIAHRLQELHHEGKTDDIRMANRLTNIVFMGMGEPLANYDALRQAIELLNSPDNFGLGARNMVVSTAGLAPQIERFSREKLQVGLAVSLHASDNALRDRLVPINRKYPLEKLIPACREYYLATGRRVTFEYVLFKGINDSAGQARSLARLLRGLNCHVNLIPANDTGDRTFQPPSRGDILNFERELKEAGINATLRQPRGQDINAGCGQLRSRAGFNKGNRVKAV
jgi:23S rRNA (adenine2503-C2)-methyltransferase